METYTRESVLRAFYVCSAQCYFEKGPAMVRILLIISCFSTHLVSLQSVSSQLHVTTADTGRGGTHES